MRKYSIQRLAHGKPWATVQTPANGLASIPRADQLEMPASVFQHRYRRLISRVASVTDRQSAEESPCQGYRGCPTGQRSSSWQ